MFSLDPLIQRINQLPETEAPTYPGFSAIFWQNISLFPRALHSWNIQLALDQVYTHTIQESMNANLRLGRSIHWTNQVLVMKKTPLGVPQVEQATALSCFLKIQGNAKGFGKFWRSALPSMDLTPLHIIWPRNLYNLIATFTLTCPSFLILSLLSS